MLDGDFETSVYCVDEIAGQGSGARIHHADGGEIVVGDDGGFAEHENDGRNDVGECNAVCLDVLAKFLEGEGRHYDEGEARVKGLVNEAGKALNFVNCCVGERKWGAETYVDVEEW